VTQGRRLFAISAVIISLMVKIGAGGMVQYMSIRDFANITKGGKILKGGAMIFIVNIGRLKNETRRH